MIQYRLSLTVVCHGCFFDKYRIDHTKEAYKYEYIKHNAKDERCV